MVQTAEQYEFIHRGLCLYEKSTLSDYHDDQVHPRLTDTDWMNEIETDGQTRTNEFIQGTETEGWMDGRKEEQSTWLHAACTSTRKFFLKDDDDDDATTTAHGTDSPLLVSTYSSSLLLLLLVPCLPSYFYFIISRTHTHKLTPVARRAMPSWAEENRVILLLPASYLFLLLSSSSCCP